MNKNAKKEFIKDCIANGNPSRFKRIFGVLLCDYGILTLKYLKLLRCSKFSRPGSLRKKFLEVRRRRLGLRLGFNIESLNIGAGLKICHPGVIIINKNCNIGSNVIIHGNTVIGNNGKEIDNAPEIRDNVDIGINTTIIGNIVVGDNVVVGAGTVVTKDVPANRKIYGNAGMIH